LKINTQKVWDGSDKEREGLVLSAFCPVFHLQCNLSLKHLVNLERGYLETCQSGGFSKYGPIAHE
jgi:hypothetical protein